MTERDERIRELARENEDLRLRLQEARETLDSIRSGEVDALIVDGPQGEQIFSLQGVDRSYRLLIEKMQEGALTMDTEGTILYANQFMERILEIPLERIVGRNFEKLVAADDLTAFMGMFRQGSHGHAAGEIGLRAESGIRPAHLSLSPIEMEGISVVCMAVTDLRDHKRHERVLAEERLNRAIIDQSADAIIVCDSRGKVIRASRAAQELVDGSALNRHFNDIFHIHVRTDPPAQSEQIPQFETFTVESVISGTAYHSREAFLEGDGAQGKYLLLSAVSLVVGEGRVIGGIVNLADITEKIRLEQRLTAEKARLNRILDTFPSGIYIASESFDIQYINPVLLAAFGPLDGKKCYEYFHGRSSPCPSCPAKQVQDGHSVRWEWYSPKNERYYELFDTPFFNEDGSISKFEVFHDITLRKHAEIERDRHALTLQVRNDISKAFLEAEAEQVFIRSLNILLDAAQSGAGCIGRVDLDGLMEVWTMDGSREPEAGARSVERLVRKPETWSGGWADALGEKKTWIDLPVI